MEVRTGAILEHFTILERLGEGGMGEVYLAYDNHLERKVALKFIRSEYTNNQELLRAFKNEALTVSKLHHPNILTIHDFKQIDGLFLMVMEYIEGETLRQCLNKSLKEKKRGLEIQQALSIAIQVAEALKEAHEAGVIHRDIKPENIMLRKGHVKVLDFGIAKLVEPKPSVGGSLPTIKWKEDSIAKEIIRTGSPQYMSPEQWRGSDLDSRTDIWSLGVVLYEMVNGKRPFDGSFLTLRDVILNDSPQTLQPIIHPDSVVSTELQAVIYKALNKTKSERYQTVEALLEDLTRIRRRIDNSESIVPAKRGFSEFIKDNPTKISIAAILILVLASIAIYKLTRPSPPQQAESTTQAPNELEIWTPKKSLTSTDNITRAATSPDGNSFVYGIGDGVGNQSLWLGSVSGTDRIQIVPPAQVQYDALTFSRDGSSIYYVKYEKNSSKGTLYRSPLLGGTKTSIMEGVPESFTYTLSPDGRQLAFVRHLQDGLRSELVIADASNGSEQRVLATRDEPLRFIGGPPLHFLGGPAWSPNGAVIVWGVRNPDTGEMRLVSVRVADGAEVASTAYHWRFVRQISWLSDSSLLVLSAFKEYGPYQIWKIAYPGGESKQIITDLNNYESLSLMTNLNAMIAVQAELKANVYVTDVGHEDEAGIIVPESGSHNDYWGFSWTRDGKILYETTRNGEQDIWLMDSDGSGQLQLTNGAGGNFDPSATPDGRYIVFTSDRTGHINIWRMDADGTNQQQLTRGMRDFAPQCSPDGKWVAYTSEIAGQLTIWKVSIDGGAPVQLTTQPSRWPAVSPDGRQIACFYEDKNSMKLAVISSEDGRLVDIFNIPATVNRWAEIRWRPGEKALTYIDTREGVSNIWSRPLDGRAPEQLTRFRDHKILRYEWSPDGKRLILSRGTPRRNVILMTRE